MPRHFIDAPTNGRGLDGGQITCREFRMHGASSPVTNLVGVEEKKKERIMGILLVITQDLKQRDKPQSRSESPGPGWGRQDRLDTVRLELPLGNGRCFVLQSQG